MSGYLKVNATLCVRVRLITCSLLRPANVSLPSCRIRVQSVPRQRPAASATSGHTGRGEVLLCGTAAVERQEADQVA